LWSRGDDAAAERVFCQISEIKHDLGEDCLALVHELHAAPPAQGYVTPEQLRQVEDRIIKHEVQK
jgi:hypothetical protein